MMNNDNGNHDARISCEETTTEDMGPATWANEPEPTPPTEPKGECEDAPCCGCCGDEGPSYDDVADSYAADAWHDAHEYPDW